MSSLRGELLVTPPRSWAPARSTSLLVLLALVPLWLMGLFGRSLWTPDEPREADIAWRMSLQSDRTLPHLAAVPFLEKPPLTYWIAAASIAVFGDSAAAARAPGLVYAAVAALSVAALALAMQRSLAAALVASLVAMSALITFRVSIWLAPDACLLAGCALALLGVWRGYRAAPGRAKAAGYALMHLGAAIGFMAKSAPAWLVPALALLAMIAWERRWQELRRWELYAGFALEALVIGPWLLALLQEPHARETLAAFFWHNLAGRFTKVASPAALDYTSGHRNFPGKYLLELPAYLLPWTLIVLTALLRAWRELRAPAPEATAWRFALCCSVPFIAVLSLAATARDVYAAPAMLGFGLLAALWAEAAQRSTGSIDRLALRLSRALIALVAWMFAGAIVVLALAGEARWPQSAVLALAVIGASHLALSFAARAARAGDVVRSLTWCYGGYAAAVCLAALVVFPIIDRWQDLPALARRIQADTLGEPLALLDPDETTIAMLDRGLQTRFTVLATARADTAATAAPTSSAPRVITGWFRTEGSSARVLVLLPGHARGALTQWLTHFISFAPLGDGLAGELTARGSAALVQRYELPQGRRYALLGPPP
ncbi:MAG TPA: glycosyltransferase family 39 protein [Steroidobacteraceae bacterium]|nr:glycosyltransferase family 39 protein [Steroidobacteraceae bacterium]